MENIRRALWAGAALAVLYLISGVIVSAAAGFAPGLVLACTFSTVGVLSALYGAAKGDIAWWAAGILITGFVTPTLWGIVPMIVALAIVLTGSILMWRRGRGGRN